MGAEAPYEKSKPLATSPAPLQYALETDSLAGAGGFEPLHLGIRIREDSQLGAGGFEHTHLN
jgi:hypothetical protein